MVFSRKDTKIIKGLAAILMVYHHLFFFPERFPDTISYTSLFSVGGETASFLIAEFGKICIALFLFLSGYGTYLSAQKTDSMDRFISKKISRLYFIYWKVLFIFVPLCILLNVGHMDRGFGALVGNMTGLRITYNGEWWFFTPYVILLVLFPLINRIINKKSDIFTDFLKLFLANTVIQFVIPEMYNTLPCAGLPGSFFWTLLIQALDLLSMFWVGALFAKYDLLSKSKRLANQNYLYSILALFTLLAVFCLRRRAGYGEFGYDFVFAPLFITASIMLLENKIFAPISWMLEKIGNHSTVIWLTHSFYCYMLCPAFVFLPKYAPLIALWLCLICCITSMGVEMFYKKMYHLCVPLLERGGFSTERP